MGGPDGGDGGKGGDVILRTSESVNTLLDFRYKKIFKAQNGEGGKGKNQEGSGGHDMIITVPVGTLVYDSESGALLADLTEKNTDFIVAKGGRGGKGNWFFTTSRQQAPRHAQPGEEGIAKKLRLELKLLADVGLVGMPNAGKSTFLSVVSKARPKIADYPFTTLSPCLGVVTYKNYPSFVVADIPGLIEGAHEGKGLGIQFLKHIERTKVLLHLVSVVTDDEISPMERYLKIKKETESFSKELKKRKQIVVLTKIDLLGNKKEVVDIEKEFTKKKIPVFSISAVSGQGMDELMKYLVENYF